MTTIIQGTNGLTAIPNMRDGNGNDIWSPEYRDRLKRWMTTLPASSNADKKPGLLGISGKTIIKFR